MHFLELAQFLNTPYLAGRKVNCTLRPAVGLYAPLLVFGPWFRLQRDSPYPHTTAVWALKPLCSHMLILSYHILSCSHLHKITNEPVFVYGACPL